MPGEGPGRLHSSPGPRLFPGTTATPAAVPGSRPGYGRGGGSCTGSRRSRLQGLREPDQTGGQVLQQMPREGPGDAGPCTGFRPGTALSACCFRRIRLRILRQSRIRRGKVLRDLRCAGGCGKTPGSCTCSGARRCSPGREVLRELRCTGHRHDKILRQLRRTGPVTGGVAPLHLPTEGRVPCYGKTAGTSPSCTRETVTGFTCRPGRSGPGPPGPGFFEKNSFFHQNTGKLRRKYTIFKYLVKNYYLWNKDSVT